MSRLLVVEDDPDIALALRLLLQRAGHQVGHAKDGRAGLRDAFNDRPELVILDIGLPGMDGYELASSLRAQPGLDALSLVALTGYGQPTDRARSSAAGFSEHLVKPASTQQVQAVIQRLLAASV
jgi:CheY-like chemotaxis protein